MILLLACTQPAAVPDEQPPDTAADTVDTADPVDPVDPIDSTEDCQLAADLEGAWFLEGDEVSATLHCAGSMGIDEVEVAAVSLPEGASYSSDTHTVTWQTGPSDSGPAELLFSVKATAEEIPTAATVTLWIADNPDIADAVPPDPMTYTAEWGLPVLFLSSDTTLSQTDQDAEVYFGGVRYDVEAKVRGASSASYPKKSYTIDFGDEEIELEEQWGHSRDHLILLTTFDDNSYVRQKLIYDQWAAMAAFWKEDRLTPRTFFVVVYLDGEYYGLYVALDRIDNEFVRHMDREDTGNLYKSVNHDANFYLTNSSGTTKSTLHDGYEKKEGEPEDDFSDLDSLVSFTGNAEASELVEGLEDWARTDEMMDWFLLVYFTLSEDSAGKNAYLYHDPQTDQFWYVPWDFNHAWGQNWYTARTSAQSLNTFTWNNRIFWAIQSDAAASEELWSRHAEMRDGGPLSEDWLVETLDGYYALIEPSAERDWAKWAESYNTYSGWYGSRSSDLNDFQGERDYLYTWIADRSAYFDSVHP